MAKYNRPPQGGQQRPITIKNQEEYDRYVNSLPNRRRKSGLKYDETHRHIPKEHRLSGPEKSNATTDAVSEFRKVDEFGNRAGGYDGTFYDAVANNRFVDDENYYSLRELIEVNKAFASGRTPNIKRDPHNVLAFANLHLTPVQITELQKNGLSDKRVYSARMIAFGTALKEKLDTKGWTIKSVQAKGLHKEDLRYVVQSGNNQIEILGFTPREKSLGNFYTKGNSVFRNSQALAMVTGGNEAANVLAPQIEYFLEGLDVKSAQKFDVFTAPPERLPNTTTVGINKKDETQYSATTRGGKRVVRYDTTFNIGHNTPSPSLSQGLQQKHETERLLEARSLTELVEQAYQKASMSSDENEVDALIDLNTIRLEDGSIDMDRVDMEVVIRNSDMTVLMRLMHEEAEKKLREGKSIVDVRNELLYGRAGLRQADDADVELSEDARNDGYDEDGMDVSEDNGAFVQQGARERIANMLVGMTDESGQPLSGWMDMDSNSNKEDYERIMETTRRAAQETGVFNFTARFDNDGVMHWSGDKGVEFDGDHQPTETIRVQHKLGQFFFPAREDEYDADGTLIRKKGVMNLRRGNGKEDLRVDNFDVSFAPPTDSRHHILERIKITGLDHKMHSAIHASVKSQVLTRSDDRFVERDTLYDTTRINKAYEDMGRLDRHRMLRPGVVEQLRSSFLIDKSYIDRSEELKEESRHATKEDKLQYGQPQSVRLPLQGLEGVYDAQASSDGGTLGLRGYFTEEFMEWIEENKNDPLFTFERTGRLGMLHSTANKETPLERWILSDAANARYASVAEEIPNLKPIEETDVPALIEEYKRYQDKSSPQAAALFRMIFDQTRSHRFMFASPMVRKMRENYAQYDSPDRVLMTAKMAEVANEIIGGPLDGQNRDRVRVALMSAGGLTFEDSIIISKDFAEKHGLRLGDKLADNHSNKGVIGYIAGLHPSHPEYNEDAEQAFIDAEESGRPLDMIQSPYGMTSRANMGLGQELINSRPERKGPIVYQTGPNKGEIRGYAGEISVIITNMDAEHKTNLYEIQDLGRHRTFSYQQNLALQSHGAHRTLGFILGDSEKKHADLLQYENVIGFTTTPDNEIVPGHFGMLDEMQEEVINGETKSFEQMDPSLEMLVVSPTEIVQNGLPTDPAYLRLPFHINAYLKDPSDNPVQTTYLPLLPERLRRETKTYDGEFVEHDYTEHLGRITDFSAQLEVLQMRYLTTYETGLEDFREALNNPDLTVDDLAQLYESNDPAFMDVKAKYPFTDKLTTELYRASADGDRSILVKDLASDVEEYKRYSKLLLDKIDNYQYSVEKDQFGVDHRSKKRSFVRRRVLSKELRNSATAIVTNDTSLDLEEIGISPAVGINAGILEPVDKDKWDAAVASGDRHLMHEAARGNWKVKEGTKDDKLMIWRDPVLHDGSVFAMKYKVDERLTGVSIHPMMTATMGADFDGDTFGVAHIADKEIQKEWDEKLNIRYNMMDARNQLAIINVGMDNVDYMKEWIIDDSKNGFVQRIPWAKAKAEADPEYFENTNPKKVLGAYLEHIEDETWSRVDDRFEQLAVEREFDYAEYDELVKQVSHKKSAMPERQRAILEQGEAIYAEAYRNVIDEYTYDTIQEMTNVIGKNAHGYRSRYVDISNEDTLLASQREMAKDGAKGKEKDIAARNEPYLKNGVTHSNIIDVRTAQKAKVDEIGRSGSQTLKVTPVLADRTFYRGRRPINGATIGMDVTETASQSILQIKHSPDDVPAALRFLKQSPRLFEGHKDAFDKADETKPVWIEFSPEMLGKTAIERQKRVADIRAGKEQGVFEEAANGTDVRLAQKLDAMLIQVYEENESFNSRHSIYMDINHGVVTNRKPDYPAMEPEKLKKYYQYEERLDWRSGMLDPEKAVDIDGPKAYRLAMKTIFNDAGLGITEEEVDYYQAALREPDESPRENAGLVLNYQRNLQENVDTLDILAQHGADGVRDVAKWNKMNPEHPKRIAETEYSSEYAVSYSNVIPMVKEEYKGAREAYNVQKTFIKERDEYIRELIEEQQPVEKVVGDKTYRANDYADVSPSNKELMSQLRAEQAATVREEPVAQTAPAKPTPVESSPERNSVKQAVKANESYTKQAVSDGRSGGSLPEASGQYSHNPFL